MEQFPAIVIVAYNRPYTLRRLVQSLVSANYPEGNISLVISIDKSNNEEVIQIAEQIEWKHGDKKVVNHPTHLGLKEHVLSCGDLTEQYGNVIVLEDDLLVSPWFYDYAVQTAEFYNNDEQVAGVSLYRYYYTENYYYPFHPVDGGFDVHFIQLPSSWGQMFSVAQWRLFKGWLQENGKQKYTDKLPYYLANNWTSTSWKKHFADYMINSGKYFVYPNIAVSTNYGEEGSSSVHKGVFQVPLLEGRRQFKLNYFRESKVYYDANFEICSEYIWDKLNIVSEKDVTIDLYGTKPLSEVKTQFLLSSKICISAQQPFGNNLFPATQNIIHQDTGSFFSLALSSSFTDSLPERVNFFVAYEAISGILQNSYIADKAMEMANVMAANAVEDAHAMYDEWCRQAEFEKKYPKILCLIMEAASAPEQKFFEKNAINYPLSQIDFKFIPKDIGPEDLVDTVNSSKAAYYTIVQQGVSFMPDAFNTINEIFTKYPDINWLTGIQTIKCEGSFQVNTQPTAARRWSLHIYKRNMYSQSGRYIPSGATFFRRDLWDLAMPQLNVLSQKSFCNDVWQAFFKFQKLYTTDAYLGSLNISKGDVYLYHKATELVETKVLHRLLEWSFIRNIPLLRKYYKELNDLAPVVRYDFKTQSHWLSEY